jgi:hypothetical protein
LRVVGPFRVASHASARALYPFIIFSFLAAGFLPSVALARKGGNDTPTPFTIDLTASSAQVEKAVNAVVQDTVIHGTQVYEKESTLDGATQETASSYFGTYKGNGQVYYKLLRGALAPRHFKNSADIGTIHIRYVVEPASADRTHLEITAVFVEDGTNRIHLSDTTVETSEFAEIQAHLVSIQREAQQTAEILQKRQLNTEAASIAKEHDDEAVRLRDAESSLKGLQQRADELQHTLEVRVANPSTALRSAPFHSAAALTTLTAGTTVLIEIITEYWYGVETSDGRRGWLRRDEVEPVQ